MTTAKNAPVPGSRHAQRVWPRVPTALLRAPAPLFAALAALMLPMLWPSAWSGRHMLLHVVAMSVVAPLVVCSVRRYCACAWHTRPAQVWMATLLQMTVFLFWHSPFGMTLAMHAASGGLLLQGSLLATAGLFWWCIAGLGPDRTWHAIAALLVTGKLFCLVAIILTFAPRALYHMMTLADQQLAGLIMITLCPLTYVASAVWLCWRWLQGLGLSAAMNTGCAPCV